MDKELKDRLDKIDDNIETLRKLILYVDHNQADNFLKLQRNLLKQIQDSTDELKKAISSKQNHQD